MAGVARYQRMVPLQALAIAFLCCDTPALDFRCSATRGRKTLRLTDNSGLGTFKLTLKLERPALFWGSFVGDRPRTIYFDDHVGLHYRRTQRLGV